MAVAIQVALDCAKPDRLARFWAGVLGDTLQDPPAESATWEAFATAQNIPKDQQRTLHRSTPGTFLDSPNG